MFEKFSISDIDSAGSGGEYTVQAGFGWTNGVVLIVASEYGQVLVSPQCPDILAEAGTPTSSSSTQSGTLSSTQSNAPTSSQSGTNTVSQGSAGFRLVPSVASIAAVAFAAPLFCLL